MFGRRMAKVTGAVGKALWPQAPVILMYHRVTDLPRDLWGITISPDRFAEQIEALLTVRRVVSLDELLAHVREGKASDRPLAAITFDDGYHDVRDVALPILERFDCPAMVYVTTGMTGAAGEFWWDELDHIFMETPRLPPHLRTTLNGRQRDWTLSSGGEPSQRESLCRFVRRGLRDMAPKDIEHWIDAFCAWAGCERAARPDRRAMTAEEIAGLSGGLMRVGAHTMTHPSLPRLDPEAQAREIARSREVCEAMTGAKVDHFAYPFGHFDRSSVRIVREAGFASAVTTAAGVALRIGDPFRLPRMTPRQADGDVLIRMLGGPRRGQ